MWTLLGLFILNCTKAHCSCLGGKGKRDCIARIKADRYLQCLRHLYIEVRHNELICFSRWNGKILGLFLVFSIHIVQLKIQPVSKIKNIFLKHIKILHYKGTIYKTKRREKHPQIVLQIPKPLHLFLIYTSIQGLWIYSWLVLFSINSKLSSCHQSASSNATWFYLKIHCFLPGIVLEDCLNCLSGFHLSFLYWIASFDQAEMETIFTVQNK